MNLTSRIESYSKKDMLNVHAIVDDSYVNGPGKRMVIWFQGCPFHCKGCFNPQTWKFKKVTLMSVDELAEQIKEYKGDGITFSGGEPMMQATSFLPLLKKVEEYDFPKGIMCFTGCELEEINATPAIYECIQHIDLAIIGRYVDSLRQYTNTAGSANQQFIFLDKPGRGKEKIAVEEVEIDQGIEVHVGKEENQLRVTGFPDIDRKTLSQLGITIVNG